jgi:hypothetical protein
MGRFLGEIKIILASLASVVNMLLKKERDLQ